jgi:hypothetical protein
MGIFMAQRGPRSIGTVLSKWLIGGILVAMLLVGSAWVVTQVLGARDASQRPTAEHQGEVSVFNYSINLEREHLRISGVANLPNGAILVGTLDKIGLGPLEIKEALVMNRVFAMEFGPELYVQYPWLGQVEALTAGTYRISVEFDPTQQSPFVREALWRSRGNPTPLANTDTPREVDSALYRVAKTFDIGTAEEQQEAQAREQQYRQVIHQHLDETVRELTVLWQRLRTQYQQDRLQRGFPKTDPRATAWQAWGAQWLAELGALGEKQRLQEAVSPAAPYRFLRDTLVTIYRQMPVFKDLYFEVLVGERSPNDRELQHAEQQLHLAFGDAFAQLGHPDGPPPTVKPDSPKNSIVIITAPLVNIRRGPAMSHEAFGQLKKDEVLGFLGEQGEWFQVKLSDGRVGWVHRNVASKEPAANGSTDDAKRGEGKAVFSERRVALRLEPMVLSATPIDYLPHPTPDDFKIYADVEQQLRDLTMGAAVEGQIAEQRVVQRVSEKYGVSPGLLWNGYLKVQGWEIRP